MPNRLKNVSASSALVQMASRSTDSSVVMLIDEFGQAYMALEAETGKLRGYSMVTNRMARVIIKLQ